MLWAVQQQFTMFITWSIKVPSVSKGLTFNMQNIYHICEFVIVKFFSMAPWNLQMNLTVNPLTDTLHNRNYQPWEDIYLALKSTYVICVESQ